jgi:hypothetical protein
MQNKLTKVTFLKKMSTSHGTFEASKTYEVPENLAKDWTEAKYCEVVVASAPIVNTEKVEPVAEPTEYVEKPIKPKRTRKQA